MVQTNPNWQLHIIHDGPALTDVKQVIKLYKHESRVHYEETFKRNACWGHPNRKMMLEKIQTADGDFILMTNDDNYYVPVFVEYFLNKCSTNAGMGYCNTIHNYMKYSVLYTRVKENYIDMGSFIVRADIAKSIGFKHMHEQADGRYAEECAASCLEKHLSVMYIDKPLFVHN
jgi:hypothetical protein